MSKSVSQPKLDPNARSPIMQPEPMTMPPAADEDSPTLDYPGLSLIPYDAKKDVTSKGVRISVLGPSHASLTNGMGLHKAYDHRAEHGITGPGYVVDTGMIYAVDPNTFQRLGRPMAGCKWRMDIIMSSTM